MKTTRRSFLAMLATALAIKPEQLIDTPAPTLWTPTAQSCNPDRILLPYMVWDSVQFQDPGTEDVLFSAPLPTNFQIHGMRFNLQEDSPVADWTQVLNAAEYQLNIAGKIFAAGPVHLLGTGPRGTRLHSALTPAGEFELKIFAKPMRLTKPLIGQFVLDGVVSCHR